MGAKASTYGEFWQIVLGPLLLLVVLFARGGIDGLLSKIGAKIGAKVGPRTSPKVRA